MASGSQLNRWGSNGGVNVLNLATTAGALGSPLTGYGNLHNVAGAVENDSGAIITPIGLSKVTFQIIGPGATAAGYTVSVYGTIDPAAYIAYSVSGGQDFISSAKQSDNAVLPTFGTTISIPASSWVLLDAPSQQAGAGVVANPMVTGTSTVMVVSGAWVAYRVVLTVVGAPTSACAVYGFGIP